MALRRPKERAQARYDEVKLYVFSDHGMANYVAHIAKKVQNKEYPQQ
jgi:hypothetical protein